MNKLFFLFIVLRFFNTLLIQTSFVPDEYWQSLEVAHRIVFGYGHLTWEWHNGLRSFIYPLLFALPYKILLLFNIDYRDLIILVPRLLMAVFAAIGDLCLYRSVRHSHRHEIAFWTMVAQYFSWFFIYSSTRTLINSFETTLVLICYYFYIHQSFSFFIFLSYFAFIIRPTAIIPLIPIGIQFLLKTNEKKKFISTLVVVVVVVVVVGLATMAVSTSIDSFMYGKITLVPVNFFMFNVYSNMSTFYGTHAWHWYLTQGVPAILGPYVLHVLINYGQQGRHLTDSRVMTLWTILVYSCLPHKEFRFLLPILPFFFIEVGQVLYRSWNSRTRFQQMWFYINWLAVILNVPIALYTCLIHQRGPLDVMDYLNAHAHSSNTSVFFLMPCHSTPYYSHIHQPIAMRFLTCEPSLAVPRVEDYLDEADRFYLDPLGALRSPVYASALASTSHVVAFDHLTATIGTLLESLGFSLCNSIFHTHFPQGRVGERIHVYCRIKR